MNWPYCITRYFSIIVLLFSLIASAVTSLHAQETDQDMPVGAVGGAVHADPFTGTATTSIPIDVPPGRGGIQPDLALVYGSNNGNGWLGMGWKLEKGVIERQTKFGVDYSGDDYVFRLSGINVELVNIGNDEYRAKIEGGFTRVKKLTASDGKPYFKATDTTGKTFIFGSLSTTRLADPNDSSKIFRWCLERVEDVHGNYMIFSYTSDQGQSYLAQIDYTGDSTTAPTNTVKFHLEGRSDAVPMYVPNFEMTTAKRLKTIELKTNGILIRAYKLSYTTSSNTSRSLLSSIQQFGKDAVLDGTGTITGGTTLPAVTPTFTTIPDTFQLWSWTSGGFWGNYELIPGDFNGDGKLDIYLHASQGSPVADFMALSTGTGFASNPWTWTSGGAWNNYEVHTGDFNGDGKTDIYLHARPGNTSSFDQMGLSTGTGFSLWTWSSGGNWQSYQVKTGDFDGDGKTDLYLHERPGTNLGERMGLSTGTGFNMWTWSWGAGWGDHDILPADYDGDGKTDIYLHARQGTGKHDYMGLSTGVGFSANPWTWTSGGDWTNFQVMPGDYNGDGKADIYLHVQPGETSAFDSMGLSTGEGFAGSSTSTPWTWTSGGNWEPYQALRGDFNGDGKADLYLHGRPGTNVGERMGYSQGDSFSLWTWSWGAGWAGNQILPGDYNGDGKADIYFHGGPAMTGFNDYLGLFNGEAIPDLLKTVSNGLGATTTLRFVPSTLYSNTQLPYPTQTVNFVKTDDGNGNVATTTYDYSGGFHHLAERDFRGFNYVKVTGPAGQSGEQIITETWFHQGNDTAVDVNNPNVADGYLKGAPYRGKVTDGSGNLYTETMTTYTADDNGQAPFFSPPASVVTNICDGNSCGKQTRTDFTYDVYGNVTREDQYGDIGTTTDDRTVVRTFDPNTTDWILSLPTSETMYEGLGTAVQLAQTTFYYDGASSCSVASTNQQPTKGQLTRIVKWFSGGTDPETRMAYDSQGNLTCTRDAKGNTTTMAYDPSGTFATSVTSALGHVTTTAYYGVNGVATTTGLYGQVKSVTGPNGAVVSTEYDVFGRRTKVIQPDGFWTTSSYNSFGTVGSQHIRTDSPLGLSTWTYFDGLGRTITQKSTGTDSKIIVSKTEYDKRGAVTRSSTPYFETGDSPLWSINTYDPMGRVIRTDNPDGSRGLACFDDWVTVTIDANDHRKRTTRDAYGRVATVQEYTGTYTTCDTSAGTPYSTTTYQYDNLGNLLMLTDTFGNQSTMSYDTLSRKTSMHDPNMGSWNYEYDANGNLTKQTDAKSQQIHFQYDALNRRVQKDFTSQKTLGSGDVIYTYDGSTNNRKGRLQKVDDGSGTTTFFYDITGRVIKTDKVVDSTTYTTQSAYDGLGRVTSLTYPDNSAVTHTYNGPQLKEVKEGSTTYASYGGFNALGQPSTLTLGNGVTTTYTYDNQNFRLKTLKTVKGSTTLQDLGYTFDAGGNVTSVTDTVHGNQTFGYDDLDRLTNASGTYPTITYAYNQIGNMTSNSQVGTYTYPSSGSNSVRPHAVTGAGSNTYTYDANGNMTSGAGRTITYDHENRPISITKNGTTTTFLYDGDGGRVKKTVDDGTLITWTTYIGKLYVCEGTALPLSCAKMIFSGSQRIAIKQVTSGSISYFHPDHLGSTSVLTDSSGTSEQDVTYYPYGDTRGNTGTANVAYKYTGKEQDDSTGLYFYEARYYDPVLGRFISADTIVPSVTDPQSLNRYTYARNNPIIFNDPSGHFFKKAFKSVKKAISAGEKFAFKNRKYLTGGQSIYIDWALTNKTIGPYIRIAGAAAASYYGGPWGAAAFSAYTTRLDGGSFGDSVKAGAIGYASAYAGSQVGSVASGAVGGGVAGQFAGAVVSGAARGAISSTVSGGDPGQGAMYGAASAAAVAAVSIGVGELYDYYATKDALATSQLSQGGQVTLVDHNEPCDYNCWGFSMETTEGSDGVLVTVTQANSTPINPHPINVYSATGPHSTIEAHHGTLYVPPKGSDSLIIPYGNLKGNQNYIRK